MPAEGARCHKRPTASRNSRPRRDVGAARRRPLYVASAASRFCAIFVRSGMIGLCRVTWTVLPVCRPMPHLTEPKGGNGRIPYKPAAPNRALPRTHPSSQQVATTRAAARSCGPVAVHGTGATQAVPQLAEIAAFTAERAEADRAGRGIGQSGPFQPSGYCRSGFGLQRNGERAFVSPARYIFPRCPVAPVHKVLGVARSAMDVRAGCHEVGGQLPDLHLDSIGEHRVERIIARGRTPCPRWRRTRCPCA